MLAIDPPILKRHYQVSTESGAYQRVYSIAALQKVNTLTAIQIVSSSGTVESVIIVAAVQSVLACVRIFGTRSRVQDVVSVTAMDLVTTRSSAESI
ncbi:hypothetical protein ASD72_18950 [Pseudoxanthomonas sp. Root630]|nr:hypothetical protein ASD72_18950 [Pseudoxanthomonas sp. Root630]